MKKPILYIDMDGVIADFKSAVLAHSLDLTEEDFINSNPEIENRVDELCQQYPRIFQKLPPIPGAIESVNLLFEYYDVYFLSTPMYELPESYMDKRIWLEKHFGDKAKKRLILTHRKDLCIGDYLIDDRTKNGAKEFQGLFIHFGYKNNTWTRIVDFLICNRR